MTFPPVHPQDSGIEPDATDQSACTHCSQPIGTPHAPTCPAVTKRVKVRYAFDLEIAVPHSWTPDDIEDDANSQCGNSALDELQAMAEEDCLCPEFSCYFVDVIDPEPRVTINEPDRSTN